MAVMKIKREKTLMMAGLSDSVDSGGEQKEAAAGIRPVPADQKPHAERFVRHKLIVETTP